MYCNTGTVLVLADSCAKVEQKVEGKRMRADGSQGKTGYKKKRRFTGSVSYRPNTIKEPQ